MTRDLSVCKLLCAQSIIALHHNPCADTLWHGAAVLIGAFLPMLSSMHAEHHSTVTSAGSVLLVMDNSEQCGCSSAQQAALYHSIKPLSANEPLLVVYDNVDVDVHTCRASQRWRI